MKIIKFFLLNRVIKDPILSAQVYHMIYHNGQPPQKTSNSSSVEEKEYNLPKISGIRVPSITGKSQMIEALMELKAKPNKTKQDKDSIGMLEAALKNGYG